ncbi:MAG: T9SS type A sorting domain-containing protein [Balneolaceae bacterium]|nr:T9SS type A sorting domain-containing protein [Balneolaceae bacterium]
MLSANIQVWDHDGGSGQGAYVELNDGDFLAPFQAFWVQYTTEITAASNTEVTFNRSNLAGNSGAEFFKQTNNTRFSFNLSVHDEQFFDPFYIEFSDEGTVEFDRYDASKLFSLNPDAIDLYGILGSNILLKNSLPERPEEIIEIPLAFDAPNRNELTFRWDGLEEIPQYWDVTLIDRTLGRELDLRREEEYTFAYQQQAQNKSFGEEETLYKATPTENGDIRFVLRINPGQVDNSGNQNTPSSNQLNPNYPNPFNPTTTISYSLTQDTQVKISVWNIVGQKVATLVDGVVEAGTHTELWNASDMPSGIYIAQMEVGGNVYIRKMTLIK